jgi:dipeptidyl aminopeptidase B
VPLPKSTTFKAEEPKALTDDTKPSFYSASFSPQSGYYWLNYQGPSIPWQKIIQVGNASSCALLKRLPLLRRLIIPIAFDYVLEQNEALKNATMEYEAPTIVRSTINSDGYGQLSLLSIIGCAELTAPQFQS